MQTKLMGDDLDFLAWGTCPECGESCNLIQRDDSHYECVRHRTQDKRMPVINIPTVPPAAGPPTASRSFPAP